MTETSTPSMPLSFPLPHRGVVTVRGEDRVSFLQGLVSNDVRRATAEQAVYAALLSPQGKFLHDMFIFATDDTLWLDVEAARADDLIAKLNKYKLRSDVALVNQTAEYGVVVSLEPQNTPPDPRHPDLGWRAIVPRASMPLENPEAFAAYDRCRITLGLPDGSRDMIIGETLLLEGNFDRCNGVDFTKGCYMGQEMTARTHYRALLKQRLMPMQIMGQTPPCDSAITTETGENVGRFRSTQGDKGLAFIKLAAAESVLHCGTAQFSLYRS